ncbi:MAG: ribonucleoside-triphosphate reductase, adenosylcobalamin-dependent [Coleofasciculus chthonoplastes F3-SA18-01]|uniref:ribonucleoside-triphosphate reductase, adenosylcobalamin-dependent n=1 Tax=Coleofasciculus chthonoplastes TaxID=64178 RepID=UPI0032FB8434
MVRELERERINGDFPETAATANPVFFRTYSRRTAKGRETWKEVCDRTIQGLSKLGKLTLEEIALLERMMHQIKSLPSGRWLWVGGTNWLENPENFSGAYNCTSTNVLDWRAFGLMMDLAMMGCGTGAVLEPQYINQLPPIRNHLNVILAGEIGTTPSEKRREKTEVKIDGNQVKIYVGDSRQGWVQSYQTLLELSADEQFSGEVQVSINVSDIRPAGESLKGFGGVANPVKLPELYQRCAAILNKAVGRQLNSVECCLLIDEAAVVVVAGNVRRSAGMRQGISNDEKFVNAKDNLWQQDEHGNWRIDPERDALRMANHSRVFHHKPTLEECIAAVRKQYYSGEGAIQWAGEAVARASCDLLTTQALRKEFLQAYEQGKASHWLQEKYPNLTPDEIEHRLQRFGLNPCVTADTWVHTEFGPRQVKDLIGKQHGTYVNGELFSTTADGFFYTGDRAVLTLATKEGVSLRLTGNHQILRISAQTQKRQYTEWVAAEELKRGDRVCLHNHRGIQPWQGVGTFTQGWLLGSLVSNGSLAQTQAIVRFWGNSQVKMAESEVATLQNNGVCTVNLGGDSARQPDLQQVASSDLEQLAAQFNINGGQKIVTPEVEQASYEFYQGFLQGLFDANGNVQGTPTQGISVRLAQRNLELLPAVQRMLLRLGIVSTVSQNSDTEDYPEKPELVIANDNLIEFRDRVGFRQPEKQQELDNLLNGYQRQLNRERFVVTVESVSPTGIESVYDCTVPGVSRFDANGIVAHNCGEIIGSVFHCNLAEIHLNQIDPNNEKEQEEAFSAGALSVAILLNHQFVEERYQKSRELDPIVGVSFTGLFDFFVKAFGAEWLHWWAEGRPDTVEGVQFKEQEKAYLTRWRDIVHRVVWEYCDKHGIKRPNRCTTVQPSGTKSLLTGASPGWHPPKAQRFIRRITFRKNDPVALACLDYGYNVTPSQSDKDENGNLLNDPFAEACSEWLVEIPVAVSWADLPGADEIDISQFSALAQMDFAMQVQRWYVTHNTSSTWELRVNEIEPLGERIYQAIQDDDGYISAALLARFDDHQSFPRLPFEPIDKATYEQLMQEVQQRRKMPEFYPALENYDAGELIEAGPVGCDSDKCMFPEQTPNA